MDERFRDNTIEEFAERLGSAAPAPGGGAAAALEAALGAALIGMVANLTTGRAKYASFEEVNRRALTEAGALKDRLLDSMDRDAKAFSRVNDAYRMPAGSEEEKAARASALAAASAEAAAAPLAVMEDSLRGLELAERLIGHSNPNLESDLIAAALSFDAAIQISAVNVDANLPAIIREDLAGAERLQGRSDEIRRKAADLMIEISDH